MDAAATTIGPTRAPLRERLIWPYVLLLTAAALATPLLGAGVPVADEPLFFAGMLAAILLMDSMDTDLLGGGHTSPTTIPSVALALLFGPVGALAAEGVLAVKRAVQRKPLVKNLFDLGVLSLAGTAAWAVAHPLPAGGFDLLWSGLAAGVVYFALNGALLVVVWLLDEGRASLGIARQRLITGAPHEIACGPIAALFVYAELQLGPIALALVGIPAAALWAGHKQSLDQTRRNLAEAREINEKLRRHMLTTVESLARTIEARDPHTGNHTERVAEFAQAIAERLGFDEDGLRALAVGAVIHDIGKIGIPDAILLKPGALDDEEWAQMRRHPEIGAYILDELDIPEHAKAMARHHHERWDGKGYPDGLAGEDIPLAARVLTVADALDAMTSDRPYRKALPMDVALAELRDKAGTQFCPRVVAAALELTSGGTP